MTVELQESPTPVHPMPARQFTIADLMIATVVVSVAAAALRQFSTSGLFALVWMSLSTWVAVRLWPQSRRAALANDLVWGAGVPLLYVGYTLCAGIDGQHFAVAKPSCAMFALLTSLAYLLALLGPPRGDVGRGFAWGALIVGSMGWGVAAVCGFFAGVILAFYHAGLSLIAAAPGIVLVMHVRRIWELERLGILEIADNRDRAMRLAIGQAAGIAMAMVSLLACVVF